MDEIIKKWINTAQSIGRLLTGGETGSKEKAELLSRNKDLHDKLFDPDYLYDMYSQRESVDTEKEWLRFREFLGRRRRKLLVRVSACAAAMLALVMVSVNLLLNKEQPESVSYEIFSGEDVTPGSTKATLKVDGMAIGLYSENSLSTGGGLTVTDSTGNVVFASEDALRMQVAKILTIEVNRGETFAVNLPDGTRVWLNSGSSLQFPEFFNAGDRTVDFYGEGYFEVSPDRSAPFIVDTRDFSVRVTGTGFNISNYNNEERASVSLVSGSVTVEDVNGNAVSVLSPGKALYKYRSDDSFSVGDFNRKSILAWRSDLFYFAEEPLSSISKALERWYDVDFKIHPDLADLKYTGELSRQNNLGTLIRILKSTNELEFIRRTDSNVIEIVPASEFTP